MGRNVTGVSGSYPCPTPFHPSKDRSISTAEEQSCDFLTQTAGETTSLGFCPVSGSSQCNLILMYDYLGLTLYDVVVLSVCASLKMVMLRGAGYRKHILNLIRYLALIVT